MKAVQIQRYAKQINAVLCEVPDCRLQIQSF